MQGPRRAPLEEDGEPHDERERERGEPEEGHPHEVRDREDQPEEHGEAAPPEVVAHDDANGMMPGGSAHGRILWVGAGEFLSRIAA